MLLTELFSLNATQTGLGNVTIVNKYVNYTHCLLLPTCLLFIIVPYENNYYDNL